MLMVFLLSFLLEAVQFLYKPAWNKRVYLAVLAGSLASLGTGVLLSHGSDIINLSILLLTIGRLFNQLRVLEDRLQPLNLRLACRRTALLLSGAQLLLLGFVANGVSLTHQHILPIHSYFAMFVSLILCGVTLRNIYKTKHQPQLQHYTDKELPTVSVLIPARNETKDLESCLRTVLANDYPKLEIIVLDDCSHDNTSDIIKGFAHAGVRFVQGSIPDDEWLSKNLAYSALAKEANGELLMFCGVDVRLGTQSIRALVTTLLNREKKMISVLPRRLDSTPVAAFVQPMRYWWELALPRRTFNRPPVLSTCWLIKRKDLKRLGGFAAVKRTIVPEAYFARELVKQSDSYSFIRSDDVLDIRTVKNFDAQINTAVRVRYPQLRKRPENVFALLAGEILFLLGPFMAVLLGLVGIGTVTLWPVLVSVLSLVTTHVAIVSVTNPANVPFAIVNFPAAVVTEIVLAVVSMIKYEFSSIEWRGRNVCIPVMQVIPHLPKL